MKLALLLLLGVIAITANAEHYKHNSGVEFSQIANFKDEVQKPGFLDGLRDSMEQKVQELAKKSIEFLERQLNDLVSKFVAKLTRLAQYSLYDVDKMARDAKTGFLLSDDQFALPCFNKHRQEFDNEQSFAREGIENCSFDATLELNVVKKNVSQHIKAIEKEVENINGILKECINIFNPFSTTKCIFKNVSNLFKSIKDIVASAVDAIKSGGENLSKVVSDTKTCIQLNVKQAETNTKDVIHDINNCIEAAHNATTTEPPATEAPETEPPTTEAQATKPPTTEAPATEPPTTEAPATKPPTTEAPATEPPAIEATKPNNQQQASEPNHQSN